jgi:iron(III) transport system permease protein
VLCHGRISRTANRAAVSARGRRAATSVELGALRWPFRALIMIYFLVGLILPVAALALVSLQPFWGARITWHLLSLANYRKILDTPALASALTNSLLLGAVGATIGVALATGLIFYAARGLRRGSRFVTGVLQVPATIPYTVLGVAFLVAFSSGPINLYGTRLLLLLVYVVMFLPQAASAMAAATSQLDRDLTEASSVAGAGKGRTLRRIVIPQLLPAMVAAWVILFILMATEVTASALLSGIGNPVVGPVIVDYFENGTFPQLAALAVLMTFADALVVLSLIRFVRRAYRGRLAW